MSKIIYTCITGNYDKLNEIKTSHRAICFTDQDFFSNTWEIRKIKIEPKIFRKIKICPHLFLPRHSQNIWIDGNLTAEDIDTLIKDKTGFWAMSHPDRYCVYQEAVRCIETKKDAEDIILRQINRYLNEGYPFSNGMITSSILIRDNTVLNKELSKLWWKEVKRHSVRDQISFNYAAWKLDLKYHTFPYLQGLKKIRHTHEQ